jgi:hypothetical protein
VKNKGTDAKRNKRERNKNKKELVQQLLVRQMCHANLCYNSVTNIISSTLTDTLKTTVIIDSLWFFVGQVRCPFFIYNNNTHGKQKCK